MKIGANKIDQAKINKMAAADWPVKKISRALNIKPEVVAKFMPKGEDDDEAPAVTQPDPAPAPVPETPAAVETPPAAETPAAAPAATKPPAAQKAPQAKKAAKK